MLRLIISRPEILCKIFQVESDKRCGEHVVNDACIKEIIEINGDDKYRSDGTKLAQGYSYFQNYFKQL